MRSWILYLINLLYMISNSTQELIRNSTQELISTLRRSNFIRIIREEGWVRAKPWVNIVDLSILMNMWYYIFVFSLNNLKQKRLTRWPELEVGIFCFLQAKKINNVFYYVIYLFIFKDRFNQVNFFGSF